MSKTEIEVTRTGTGEIVMDLRVITDAILLGLAKLHVERRAELSDLLADMAALHALESRGMHAEESSVEAVQAILYNTLQVSETVTLSRDDINGLRRAMDDPDKPKFRPAFQNNGQGMQAMSKVEPIQPDSESTSETPIYEQAKAAQNGA